MTPRSLLDRLLSPAGFGLALIFFFLPFATVSCGISADSPEMGWRSQSAEISFTGVDLLIGGAPDISITDRLDGSPSQTRELGAGDVAQFEEEFGPGHPPQILAVVAAVVILAGMAGSLLLPRLTAIRVSAAAALAALILIVVEVVGLAPMAAADALTASDAYRSLQQERGRLPFDIVLDSHTRPGIGFYLTTALLAALLARQILVARRPLPVPPAGDPEPSLAVEDQPA